MGLVPFASSIKAYILSLFANQGYRIVSVKDFDPASLDSDSPAFRAQADLINLIKPDKLVIYDVGANIGQAYQIYRHLFPGARIFCFEPFPESCKALGRLVESDCLCSVHQLALSCHSGLADFNVNRSSPTNSLLPTAPSSSRFWGEGLLETSDVIQVEKQLLIPLWKAG